MPNQTVRDSSPDIKFQLLRRLENIKASLKTGNLQDIVLNTYTEVHSSSPVFPNLYDALIESSRFSLPENLADITVEELEAELNKIEKILIQIKLENFKIYYQQNIQAISAQLPFKKPTEHILDPAEQLVIDYWDAKADADNIEALKMVAVNALDLVTLSPLINMIEAQYRNYIPNRTNAVPQSVVPQIVIDVAPTLSTGGGDESGASTSTQLPGDRLTVSENRSGTRLKRASGVYPPRLVNPVPVSEETPGIITIDVDFLRQGILSLSSDILPDSQKTELLRRLNKYQKAVEGFLNTGSFKTSGITKKNKENKKATEILNEIGAILVRIDDKNVFTEETNQLLIQSAYHSPIGNFINKSSHGMYQTIFANWLGALKNKAKFISERTAKQAIVEKRYQDLYPLAELIGAIEVHYFKVIAENPDYFSNYEVRKKEPNNPFKMLEVLSVGLKITIQQFLASAHDQKDLINRIYSCSLLAEMLYRKGNLNFADVITDSLIECGRRDAANLEVNAPRLKSFLENLSKSIDAEENTVTPRIISFLSGFTKAEETLQAKTTHKTKIEVFKSHYADLREFLRPLANSLAQLPNLDTLPTETLTAMREFLAKMNDRENLPLLNKSALKEPLAEGESLLGGIPSLLASLSQHVGSDEVSSLEQKEVALVLYKAMGAAAKKESDDIETAQELVSMRLDWDNNPAEAAAIPFVRVKINDQLELPVLPAIQKMADEAIQKEKSKLIAFFTDQSKRIEERLQPALIYIQSYEPETDDLAAYIAAILLRFNHNYSSPVNEAIGKIITTRKADPGNPTVISLAGKRLLDYALANPTEYRKIFLVFLKAASKKTINLLSFFNENHGYLEAIKLNLLILLADKTIPMQERSEAATFFMEYFDTASDDIASFASALLLRFNENYTNAFDDTLVKIFLSKAEHGNSFTISPIGKKLLDYAVDHPEQNSQLYFAFAKAIQARKDNFNFSLQDERLYFQKIISQLSIFPKEKIENFILNFIVNYLEPKLNNLSERNDVLAYINEFALFVNDILANETVKNLAQEKPLFTQRIQQLLSKYERQSLQWAATYQIPFNDQAIEFNKVTKNYHYFFCGISDVLKLENKDVLPALTNKKWLEHNQRQLNIIFENIKERFPEEFKKLNKGLVLAKLIYNFQDADINLASHLAEVEYLLENKHITLALMDYAIKQKNMKLIEKLLRSPAAMEVFENLSKKQMNLLQKSIHELQHAKAFETAKEILTLDYFMSAQDEPGNVFERKDLENRAMLSAVMQMPDAVTKLSRDALFSILFEQDKNVRNMRFERWITIAEYLFAKNGNNYGAAIVMAFKDSAITRFLDKQAEAGEVSIRSAFSKMGSSLAAAVATPEISLQNSNLYNNDAARIEALKNLYLLAIFFGKRKVDYLGHFEDENALLLRDAITFPSDVDRITLTNIDIPIDPNGKEVLTKGGLRFLDCKHMSNSDFAKALAAVQDKIKPFDGNILPPALMQRLNNLVLRVSESNNYKNYNEYKQRYLASYEANTDSLPFSAFAAPLSTEITFTRDGNKDENSPKRIELFASFADLATYVEEPDLTPQQMRLVAASDPSKHLYLNADADRDYLATFFYYISNVQDGELFTVDDIFQIMPEMVSKFPDKGNISTQHLQMSAGKDDIVAADMLAHYGNIVASASQRILSSEESAKPALIRRKLVADKFVENIINKPSATIEREPQDTINPAIVKQRKALNTAYIKNFYERLLLKLAVAPINLESFYRLVSVNPLAAGFFDFSAKPQGASAETSPKFLKTYLDGWLNLVALYPQFRSVNTGIEAKEAALLDPKVEDYLSALSPDQQNNVRWFFHRNPLYLTPLLSYLYTKAPGTDTYNSIDIKSIQGFTHGEQVILSLLAYSVPNLAQHIELFVQPNVFLSEIASLKQAYIDNNKNNASNLLESLGQLLKNNTDSYFNEEIQNSLQHLTALIRASINVNYELPGVITAVSDWAQIVAHLLDLRNDTNQYAVTILVQTIIGTLSHSDFETLLKQFQTLMPQFDIKSWMSGIRFNVNLPSASLPAINADFANVLQNIFKTYKNKTLKNYDELRETSKSLDALKTLSDVEHLRPLVVEMPLQAFDKVHDIFSAPVGIILHHAENLNLVKKGNNYTIFCPDEQLLLLQQSGKPINFNLRWYKEDGTHDSNFFASNKTKIANLYNYEFTLPKNLTLSELQDFVADKANIALSKTALTDAPIVAEWQNAEMVLTPVEATVMSQAQDLTVASAVTTVPSVPTLNAAKDAATSEEERTAKFTQFLVEEYEAKNQTLPPNGEVTTVVAEMMSGSIDALSRVTVDASNISSIDTMLKAIRDSYYNAQAIPFNYNEDGIVKKGYIFARDLELSSVLLLPRMIDYMEGALLIARNSGLTDEKLIALTSDIISISAFFIKQVHELQDPLSVASVTKAFNIFNQEFLDSLIFLLGDHTKPTGIANVSAKEKAALLNAHESGRATFEDLRLAAGLCKMLNGYNTIVAINNERASDISTGVEHGNLFISISDPVPLPGRTLQQIEADPAYQKMASNHGKWLTETYKQNFGVYTSTCFPTSLREMGAANVRDEQLWVKNDEELLLLSQALRTGFITPKDLRNPELRRNSARQNLIDLIKIRYKNAENNFMATFGDWLTNLSTASPLAMPIYYGTLVSNNEKVEKGWLKKFVKRDFFHSKPKWDSESELVDDKLHAMTMVKNILGELTGTENSSIKPELVGTNNPVNEGQYIPGIPQDLSGSNRLLEMLTGLLGNLSHSAKLKEYLKLELIQPVQFETSLGTIISYLNNATGYDPIALKKSLEILHRFLYLIPNTNVPKSLQDKGLMDLFLAIQASVYLKYINTNKLLTTDQVAVDNTNAELLFADLDEEEVPLDKIESNIPLLRAVYEQTIVHGMRGLLFGSCKSSADRFATVLMYSRSMREDAYNQEGWLIAPTVETDLQPKRPLQTYADRRDLFYQRVKAKTAFGEGPYVIEDNGATRALKRGEIEIITSEDTKRKSRMQKISAKVTKGLRSFLKLKSERTPDQKKEKKLSDARKEWRGGKLLSLLKSKKEYLITVPYARYQIVKDTSRKLQAFSKTLQSIEAQQYHLWMAQNNTYLDIYNNLNVLKNALALRGMDMKGLTFAEKLLQTIEKNLYDFYQTSLTTLLQNYENARNDFLTKRKATSTTREESYLEMNHDALLLLRKKFALAADGTNEVNRMSPENRIAFLVGTLSILLNANESLYLAGLQKRYSELRERALILSEQANTIAAQDAIQAIRANIIGVQAHFEAFNNDAFNTAALDDAEKLLDEIQRAINFETCPRLVDIVTPTASKADLYAAFDKVYSNNMQGRLRATAMTEQFVADEGKKVRELPKSTGFNRVNKSTAKKVTRYTPQTVEKGSDAYVTACTITALDSVTETMEAAKKAGENPLQLLAAVDMSDAPTDSIHQTQLKRHFRDLKEAGQIMDKDSSIKKVLGPTLRSRMEEFNNLTHLDRVIIAGTTNSLFESTFYLSSTAFRHTPIHGVPPIKIPMLGNLELKPAHTVGEVWIQLAEYYEEHPYPEQIQLAVMNYIFSIAIDNLLTFIKGHFNQEKTMLQQNITVVLGQWTALFSVTRNSIPTTEHDQIFAPFLKLFDIKKNNYVLKPEIQRLLGQGPVFTVPKPCAVSAAPVIDPLPSAHLVPQSVH